MSHREALKGSVSQIENFRAECWIKEVPRRHKTRSYERLNMIISINRTSVSMSFYV